MPDKHSAAAPKERSPFIPYADVGNTPDHLKELLDRYVKRMGSHVGFWKLYNTVHDALRIPLEKNLLARSQTVGIP